MWRPRPCSAPCVGSRSTGASSPRSLTETLTPGGSTSNSILTGGSPSITGVGHQLADEEQGRLDDVLRIAGQGLPDEPTGSRRTLGDSWKLDRFVHEPATSLHRPPDPVHALPLIVAGKLIPWTCVVGGRGRRHRAIRPRWSTGCTFPPYQGTWPSRLFGPPRHQTVTPRQRRDHSPGAPPDGQRSLPGSRQVPGSRFGTARRAQPFAPLQLDA